MHRRFSIRTKLAVFVVLLVGITGMVIASFVLWYDYRAEQDEMKSDGHAKAAMFQHVLLDPLRQEDDFHIYELLSAPFLDGQPELGLSKRALQHIVLLDDQGSVLASSDPTHFPLLVHYAKIEPEFAAIVPELASLTQSMAPRWVSYAKTSDTYLMVPLGENGVKYATLIMNYSMRVIYKDYAKKALRSIGFISLISFVLMFLASHLARRFSAPLLALTHEMRTLARGHGALVSEHVEHADEIVQLEQTFHAFERGLVEAKKQRDASLQRERLALAALDHSTQGVIITTPDANIIYVNSAYARTVGYSVEELLEKNPRILKSSKTPPETYQSMWAALNAGRGWQGEMINRRKDGSEFLQLLTISVIRNEKGQTSHLLGIQEDISNRRAAEEHMRYLAQHDALTGLPNRILLEDRLEQAIKSAARHNDRFALMFLDLDNFKEVNDLQGHHKGDILLKMVAERLLDTVRDSDTVARLGGDEFVLLVPKCSEAEASLLAAKIVKTLSLPYPQEEGGELTTSVSLGISLYPDHGQTAEMLTMCADIGMYHAKSNGRNAFSLFLPEMQGDLRERVTLENDLRLALVQRQFVLHYQPQFDVQTGKISGLEALIRWQHPQYGLLHPGNFLQTAEDSGLIVEIGAWVIDEVCRHSRMWQDLDLKVPCIAANVSFKQFHGTDLQATVIGALERYHLSGTDVPPS